MRHSLKILFAAFIALPILLAGCGKQEGGGTKEGQAPSAPTVQTAGKTVPAGKRLKVYLLPKKKGLPYFTTCAEGAAEAAKELGNIDLVYDGPTDGAAEKSAAMIEQWTLKGADVIAIAPNDPDVLAPAMKQARAKGVHVITWDADGAADSREVFVNQATYKGIGYALIDQMVKDLGGKEVAEGEVAVVTATLTAFNQNEWIKYMKERLVDYPKLKLVAIKPSKEDQKLAFQVAQDLMKAYPNLKGLFAISSVAFPGAAEAVKQAGQAGKVQVLGISTPNDMRDYVKDGTVKSVILWNTIDLGYLTIRVADALARGQYDPKAPAFKAGRLGEKKIQGDSVLLGDILIFNKDNIDQYHF